MAEATGGQINATLIPGDGIGPEIVDATLTILDALGAPFVWSASRAGWRRSSRAAIRCRRPRSTASAARARAQGAADTPVGRRLSLVERAPARGIPALRQRAPGAHDHSRAAATRTSTSSLVRENLEGLYVGFEHYMPIADDPHAVAMVVRRQHARRARAASSSSPSTTRSRTAARRSRSCTRRTC